MRLGEALPVVFFSSAVDFILPVNCRRSTTAVRAASGTAGKMNSPEAEPRHAGRHAAGGAASMRTIVLTLAKASSVILGRCENAVTTPNHIRSFAIKKCQQFTLGYVRKSYIH